MYTGTLIEDLGKTVAKADHLTVDESLLIAERLLPISVRDYVSFEECRAMAEEQMAKDHPEILKITNGDAIADFAIRFATYVAWKAAAEATRRSR
jgi:hypothetical protein